MAGRYDPTINLNTSSLAPSAPSADEQRRRKQSDLLHFLGSMAPAAGGALGMGIGAIAGGGLPGAALGGAIGGGIGQLAGGGLNYAGSEETQQDDNQRAMANQKRNDLFATLMAMRR